MGIDDPSRHPTVVFRSCRRRYMPKLLFFGVRLFREPDAGNPPVRFDEREEETELCQTGLRRRGESSAIATGRLPSLRLFSTPLKIPLCCSIDLGFVRDYVNERNPLCVRDVMRCQKQDQNYVPNPETADGERN
jgi:hypothetical protein